MTRGKYYRPADLDGYDRDALWIIVEARGVKVEGSGRNGYVTVEDLRAAITADQDRSGINPAIVALPADEQIVDVVVVAGRVNGFEPGARLALFDNAQTAALIESGAVRYCAPIYAEPEPTTIAGPDEPAGDPSPDNDDMKGD